MLGMKDDDIDVWRAYIKNITPLDKSNTPIPKPIPIKKHSRHYTPLYPRTVQKKLDLHGLTVNEAFEAILGLLSNSYYSDVKSITIITGRSGQIKRDFPFWMENPRLMCFHRGFEEINPGSFLVKIKKIKS